MRQLTKARAREIARVHNGWVGCQSGSAIGVSMESGRVNNELLTGGAYLNPVAAQHWALLRIGWVRITAQDVLDWWNELRAGNEDDAIVESRW